MSRIQIDISKVRSCNEDLRRNNLKISNIARDIFLSMGSIDSRIQARRNIGSRLKNACDECNKIEQKLTKLQKFISNSMDRYEKAERKVENESEELIALWNLRMETLVELKSMVGILGTSSSYIENAKMFYDGEKVGDDDDEDTEEILEETDELLKEVNEEDDNDWTRQPAKEDIFDKFADWITEKVTGEKASPKTQGEEVIDAQLTTMSFDEQSILADIASDYQTAFRGLASADRINEALENFEEEPVFSSVNNTKVAGEANKALPTKIPYEFMNDTVDHIFNGVVKNPGTVDEYATGWHYIGSGASNGNKIIQITRDADEFGTIEAKVEIGGVTKDGISTLFSDKYTPNEVVDMIMQAHMNKTLVPGSRGLYRGVADNGMTIEMYLYRNPEGCNISDVITAYPVYADTLK